jgi:hypothetical protein
VRAADTRIKSWNAAISADFDFAHRNRSRANFDQLPPDLHPQLVTLDAPLLRLICAPVRIAPGGEDWCDVARRLGRHPESLRYAIEHNIFTVRHVPRLGGKRGKPVPILSSRRSSTRPPRSSA